ncbi:hypothetical protein Kpol_242p4 [Vanderwaltozyma polyspora DSM 70294]|uniref:Nuclear protein localization protein 4 n=1 Tax=Vanderwaltozyma polyspora (strain ATCC 22028 / DSM 70294 / BCRC 21397 / CBS 2163 / NBRC 10782 / NRRL Y-8283 / UCD 57-17) TaxID=436907 RepID=NPL4_VANPO|nr:uncharacterized protein Kpol_242p4 [Vanderwaltozyma polyspora DSM 70294]A7TTC4.1 RecName: Full=Nuclear protein localization protein 4 [Vanderwaltozyma polyspora DSM 70294]EDO14481.1 hypothetical protein Kpol_242p4 [Vanderwaltozyma polyspora DSM 70294]
MLLRFRSKIGMNRVSCEATDLFGDVVENWVKEVGLNVDPGTVVVGNDPGSAKEPVSNIAGRSVEEMGLKHGDIVYIEYSDSSGSNEGQSVPVNAVGAGSAVISELPVDVLLEKEDGLIKRTRSSLCKHGDKGMCEYCSPLPPWDKEYHAENKLKHISFHSYLKKLNEATNKKSSGSSYIPPLSQPDYKINKRCNNGHEPWPRGICSKCQPSAITLQQQEFRMVDHVEIQQSDLINQFIESWRATGMQRFGYLYGSYEKYDSTPLGVKAVVHAIYEPPQHDEQDGLTMDLEQVEEEMQKVDQIAMSMGLLRVGLIFSDLTDTGNGNGTVFCKRHKDSFFLSSLEIIMAAKHQLAFPNASRFSEQGKFSSKFVTCVVSGNLDSEIDITSYQVSIEAEALVDAKMISGSTHPSMAYINETNEEVYVPEIFYMKTNEYGLTVKENAKPAFPVDYLLVSLTHGFITEDSKNQIKFHSTGGFPWANRQAMGLSQDYQELKNYLYSAATGGDYNLLHEKISNFHLLLYIKSLEIFNEKDWSLLITSAISENWEQPLIQLTTTESFNSLVLIMEMI